MLNAGTAASLTEELEAFRNSMRSLGYVENRDVRFKYRFTGIAFLEALVRRGLASALILHLHWGR
jgi:hypothetical protein